MRKKKTTLGKVSLILNIINIIYCIAAILYVVFISLKLFSATSAITFAYLPINLMLCSLCFTFMTPDFLSLIASILYYNFAFKGFIVLGMTMTGTGYLVLHIMTFRYLFENNKFLILIPYFILKGLIVCVNITILLVDGRE